MEVKAARLMAVGVGGGLKWKEGPLGTRCVLLGPAPGALLPLSRTHLVKYLIFPNYPVEL